MKKFVVTLFVLALGTVALSASAKESTTRPIVGGCVSNTTCNGSGTCQTCTTCCYQGGVCTTQCY